MPELVPIKLVSDRSEETVAIRSVLFEPQALLLQFDLELGQVDPLLLQNGGSAVSLSSAIHVVLTCIFIITILFLRYLLLFIMLLVADFPLFLQLAFPLTRILLRASRCSASLTSSSI